MRNRNPQPPPEITDWWLISGDSRGRGYSGRFRGTFQDAVREAVGSCNIHNVKTYYVHEDRSMWEPRPAPVDYVGDLWAVAHKGGWSLKYKPRPDFSGTPYGKAYPRTPQRPALSNPPLLILGNPGKAAQHRTCIRCGAPYQPRARRLPAPAGQARAFEERYCTPCAERLPLRPVITEVRGNPDEGRVYEQEYNPAGLKPHDRVKVGRATYVYLGRAGTVPGHEANFWKGLTGPTIYYIYVSGRTGELYTSPAAQQFSYMHQSIKRALRAQQRGTNPAALVVRKSGAQERLATTQQMRIESARGGPVVIEPWQYGVPLPRVAATHAYAYDPRTPYPPYGIIPDTWRGRNPGPPEMWSEPGAFKETGGLHIEYLPVNQAWALMWLSQVLRIFNAKWEAQMQMDEYLARGGSTGRADNPGHRGADQYYGGPNYRQMWDALQSEFAARGRYAFVGWLADQIITGGPKEYRRILSLLAWNDHNSEWNLQYSTIAERGYLLEGGDVQTPITAMDLAEGMANMLENPGRGGNPLTDPEAAAILSRARDHMARARFWGWKGGGPVLAARAETAAGIVNEFSGPRSHRAHWASGTLLNRVRKWTSDRARGIPDPHEHRMARFPARMSRRRNPARGGNSHGIPARIWNDPRFQAELKAYKARHGTGPVEVRRVKVPKGYPRYMSAWGRAPHVVYDAPKHSNKGKRIHRFGEGGGTEPYLVSSAERGRKFLAYVGGTYRADGRWIYK